MIGANIKHFRASRGPESVANELGVIKVRQYHRYELGERMSLKGLYLISRALKKPLYEFFVVRPALEPHVYKPDNSPETVATLLKTEADLDNEIAKKLKLINVELKAELLTIITLFSRANPADISQERKVFEHLYK